MAANPLDDLGRTPPTPHQPAARAGGPTPPPHSPAKAPSPPPTAADAAGNRLGLEVQGTEDLPPHMLDVVLRHGVRHAFPYSYLTEVRFTNEGAVELYFGTKRVSIKGRNLQRLYELAARHVIVRITSVGEMDRMPEHATVVSSITIVDLSDEDGWRHP
jgi:hypothetical protein